MDTQKVEKYAGVVSKIATGLKVWNIIGIFANLFVLIGAASTFVPSVQEELAKQLGINRNTYAKYEKYKASMRIDMAQKFSSIVGISIDNLIFLNNNYTSSVERLH